MNIKIRCTGFATIDNIADLLPAPVLSQYRATRYANYSRRK